MLRIVKATPKHCKRIVEIAKEGNIFNYTLLFYSLLVALGWVYVVLDDNLKVIAYTCYAIIPGTKTAFSFQTAVSEEYRSQQIGTKLMGFSEAKLKDKHKVATIYAHCLKPRVVKLLQRLRWKVVLNILQVAFVRKELR